MAGYKRNTVTAYITIPQLEQCDRRMFGDLVLTCQTPIRGVLPKQVVQPIPYTMAVRRASVDSISAATTSIMETEKRRASALVDELLVDIYYSVHNGSTDYNSTSGKSHRSSWMEFVNLRDKDIEELLAILSCLRNYIERMGSVLVRQLKRRDALRRQQEANCDVITKRLHLRVPQTDPAEGMRFTIQPLPGDTGFSQWAGAMKMVAQLPGGIPTEFRRRLWLTLAERHLLSKGVSWPEVEKTCFSEWSHPADAELGVQIVKDLHRTGCSLFCGEDGQENQALLKRVLLAYARWNKAVGYCQGFNMLAALILQVTEKSESDALKLMIYLIEGVLPDSYFADSLRGLSVDMAVFRELLRSRLPRLSKHLDLLQNAAKDGSRSYEPPLTNVFTMQWFLTLFCNCLPHPTVLRVWDLILLEGNEILLRTALAIWQVLAERILSVRSADEFYCVMGVLMRELLEFDLIDGNSLVKAMVAIGPLTELKTLRKHYLYNINPWGASLPQAVDKQLKLYSKQSIALDISALKKQYGKLKQRQRQAHIIFSAAISRQPAPVPPVTMNHLLIGKNALVSAKRLGPPQGAIPPARQVPSTLHWKDAPKQTSSSSSSDTELCDDESASSDEDVQTNQPDNLPLDLMKNDNREIEDAPASPSPNQPTETLDEESSDFEQFLADRVKRLKVSEDDQEEGMSYARRNSVRALQIIQENSMILHRILQCQSRLSPSPPPIQSEDAVSDVSESVSKLTTSDETGIDLAFDCREIDAVQSPEYGSKYSSILEKSKSLDEKYNALILKKPTVSKTVEELSSDMEKAILDTSCSTETFASYDTAITKTDGNLPILVEEAVNLDGKKAPIDSFQYYKTYGLQLQLESNASKESQAKLFEPDDDVFGSVETKRNNDESFKFKAYEGMEDCFSSSPVDIQLEEPVFFGHSEFLLPEPTRFKLETSDGDAEDNISKGMSNEETLPSTSEFLDGYSNSERLALSQIEFSTLNDTSDVIFADSVRIITHLRNSPSNNTELNLHISPDEDSWKNYTCTSKFMDYGKMEPSEKVPTVSSPESPSKTSSEAESKMLHSGLDCNQICEELTPNRYLEAAISNIDSINEDYLSIETGGTEVGQCTIELPHENDEISDESGSRRSPPQSSRDCLSRSTSPFISNDWYSTERSNKNLGLEAVAVGGSPSSRSPSRPVSLSPVSYPSAATTSKSPSKCFNPFPVPLGSRQNKEVPIKLGLYKK